MRMATGNLFMDYCLGQWAKGYKSSGTVLLFVISFFISKEFNMLIISQL